MLLVTILQLSFCYTIKRVILTSFSLIECKSNAQICALEAIFGDAVVVFDNKGGQRSFQVCTQIHFLGHILSKSKDIIC